MSLSPKKLKRICDMRFTERVDRLGRTRRDMVPFSKPVLAQCALWNYVNELIELVRWARYMHSNDLHAVLLPSDRAVRSGSPVTQALAFAVD
jgi:hypothetical protein